MDRKTYTDGLAWTETYISTFGGDNKAHWNLLKLQFPTIKTFTVHMKEKQLIPILGTCTHKYWAWMYIRIITIIAYNFNQYHCSPPTCYTPSLERAAEALWIRVLAETLGLSPVWFKASAVRKSNYVYAKLGGFSPWLSGFGHLCLTTDFSVSERPMEPG